MNYNKYLKLRYVCQKIVFFSSTVTLYSATNENKLADWKNTEYSYFSYIHEDISLLLLVTLSNWSESFNTSWYAKKRRFWTAEIKVKQDKFDRLKQVLKI